MKTALFLILLVTYDLIAGGFYYSSNKNYVDGITGNIFIPINASSSGFFGGNEKIESSVNNYLIYNPSTKKSILVFPDTQSFPIVDVIFESYYDSINRAMVLNQEQGEGRYYSENNSHIINNKRIEKREPSEDVLFVLNSSKLKTIQRQVYAINKNGTNLRKLFDETAFESWHIDIANKVIRRIQQTGKTAVITEMPWK